MPTLADALRGYQPPTTSALADPIVEHFRNLPQTTAQNAINTNNMVQNSFPYDFDPKQPMLTANPNYDPQAAKEFANYIPNLMGATAFHGTPHKILGKFDISKVGTGEGAQAYGHGMYFAENPAVATEYRKALSGRTDLNQQPSDPAFIHAVESFRQAGTPLELIPSEMKKAYKSATDKDIQLAIQSTEKGNLYKVDIPDEHIPNMLDWDKPLSKQTSEVQAILKDRFPSAFDDLRQTTGQALYKEQVKKMAMSGERNSEKFMSNYLNEYGIKGIRYLDEGSRGKGGTSNFVVFDPFTVKILEENGKPLTRKELIQEQINKIEQN